MSVNDPAPLTASRLIEFLYTVPPDTPIRASYDVGCAIGTVVGAKRITIASSGDVEVELEVG